MATHVVTVFLRNDGDVLLLRRSAAVGSYAGKWGAVAGHAEGAPDDLAREEIREETGIGDAAVTLVARGDPFEVHDDDHGTWVVHPYLFDCDTRAVETDEETAEYEWTPPTEILRRETVPDLWTSYDRVRPTVETVADDAVHGSAYVSMRALEVLRDEAALAAERGGSYDDVAGVARDLLDARPSMRAVVNRVNRAMATADERTPAAVERAVESVLDDAASADREAAAAAADLAGERVLTLSRSGTVRRALASADPEAVYVAESRPAREGVEVAEELAETTEVILCVDAAVAGVLATGDVDSVVVGADTVLADGRVVNKVGTRAAALAAAREEVPCYAVTARDKVSPEADAHLEYGDPGEVYDGDADVDVLNPTFDVAPADCVTAVTEAGPLDGAEIATVAEEHAGYAGWQGEG